MTDPSAEQKNWEVTLPVVGMKVRVRYQTGCPEEMGAHGMWPFTNGVIGEIIGLRRDTSDAPGEHRFIIASSEWSQAFQYFALHELVPYD